MDPRITQIRRVLDALARVENKDNDTKEVVYDDQLAKIRDLDRTNIIDIVKEAVGDDKRRRRYAAFVFSELYDVQGIELVFQDLLETSDANGRADIVQTIGLRRMKNLVGVLNEHFTKEADDFCRYCLLHALGKLADESSLPIFSYLMRKDDKRDEWTLVVAGQSYARPEFKDYLRKVFEDQQTEKPNRIMAAWGLARIGSASAYDYLVSMLDDPEETRIENGTTTYDPGQSIRAAQAIADINGWGFEWGKSSVDLIKAKIAGDS